MVSFDVSDADSDLIDAIVTRAATLGELATDETDLSMDITAVHSNGNPLDLAKLLNAPTFDFRHEIVGIQLHIDRRTGELRDHFDPRCSLPVIDVEDSIV